MGRAHTEIGERGEDNADIVSPYRGEKSLFLINNCPRAPSRTPERVPQRATRIKPSARETRDARAGCKPIRPHFSARHCTVQQPRTGGTRAS